MEKIIVFIPFEIKEREKILNICDSVEVIFRNYDSVSKEEVENATVILGNIPIEKLMWAKKLKWLQLNSAGVDLYVRSGVLGEKVVLTNCVGAFNLALAEHSLAVLLMLMKKLHLYRDNQNSSLWQDEGRVSSLVGANVLVVGFGNIGKEFGKKINLLGAKVYGVSKTLKEKPSFAEEVYTSESLDDLIPLADIIFLCLPETKETKGLFNKERFLKMKKKAYFINVGRGSSVDEQALYTALANGDIAGASIDVTVSEPLAKESPLWGLKNLLITPHISGWYHLDATYQEISRIAIDNLVSFLTDKPLINLVDVKRGY